MAKEFIWSNTDFPYMCLLDKIRTLAFKEAIETSVHNGDTVVDIGSGSGIMSLFAAKAGGAKVYAVEIDHTLAEALHKTAKANNFQSVIEVVEGDAMEVELPKNVDVVVAELIETGLMDEWQVPVINRLIKDGIIGEKTKVIPSGYTTFVEPVYAEHEYYDFKIFAPQHDWPFFHDSAKSTWTETPVSSLAKRKELSHLSFKKDNDPKVDASLDFEILGTEALNAVRLSGVVWLRDNQPLGPTNTLNSNKVFMIEPLRHSGKATIDIAYEMGRGMQSLKFGCRV